MVSDTQERQTTPFSGLQAKRTEHTNAILYPDHTFTDWQEASTASWEQEKFLIQQAAKSYPWSTRTPQLLFRGNSVTRNGNIAADLQPSAELDVRVWDWIQDRQGFLGLAEHCKNKYLLNWPGNSYSARYKYLLLCGSVVLHGDNGYYEFFYPMLKDGLNIVKTQGLDSKEDLEFGLKSLVQQLEADPMLAHCIALAGQQFAANVLTDDNLTEYWFRLLEAYAELQRHSVELSEDAVILSSSLSNPEYVDIKHRSGCSS